MLKEREQSVDIAKGLGIILVVFGHTIAVWGGDHEILHRFVYSFHMPLFFGVSGMYISTNSSLISFIKSKVTRFVIPFLFWVMFYFFLYLIIRIVKTFLSSFVIVNEVTPILDFQTLKNLCIVPILGNWSSINRAGIYIDLWFLPAIFSTVILFRLLFNKMGRQGTATFLIFTIFLSSVVVYINNRHGFHNNVPWSIDVAIVCLPFLIISRLHSYIERLHWSIIPFSILAIYCLSKNMNIEVAGLRIEHYTKFLATATCGITMVFLISAKIQSSQAGKILSEVGKRSYLIFVLQGLMFIIFKPILSRLPGLGTNGSLFNCTLFLAVLVCGYMMYPLFNRYRYVRLFALGQK